MSEEKREVAILRVGGAFSERGIWLARTSGNRYTLRFRQIVIYSEDRVRIPAARSLKSGEDIWGALARMVASLGAYDIADVDVDEVVANVAMIDATLAEEVRRAATANDAS